jgi:ABC transport system ATP-binding/permease protein
MDKLADQLFILTGDGEVKIFLGSYTEFREEEKEREKAESKAELKKEEKIEAKAEPVVAKRKLTYKEKFEFESLDKEISELEKKKAVLMEELSGSTSNHEQLLKLSADFGETTRLLDEKQFRWLELSEMSE